MLEPGGRSVTGDQSKGKEGNIFGYSVLDTFPLRNCLVPDPKRLPDILKKHFTEQMSDFVEFPWSEVQGGDLDGEHSEILTHALTTLLGKQNDKDLLNYSHSRNPRCARAHTHRQIQAPREPSN
jgi:hypothetical protein